MIDLKLIKLRERIDNEIKVLNIKILNNKEEIDERIERLEETINTIGILFIVELVFIILLVVILIDKGVI